MVEFIQNALEQAGYWGLALFGLVENFFPPVPEELVLPLAGYHASQDSLNLWWITLAVTVGATAGALVWFFVGRRVGKEKFMAWADRHGKWFTVSGKDIDNLSKWFERHGEAAVFICRLIPGLRSAVAVPAGFSGMSPLRFALYYFPAAAIWSFALTYAGFLLGRNYSQASEVVKYYSYAVLVIGVLYYIYRLVTHQRSEPSRSKTQSKLSHRTQ